MKLLKHSAAAFLGNQPNYTAFDMMRDPRLVAGAG
jgi:hypothetical protein